MEGKLFPSELHVMNVLWAKGPTTAKEIADILGESVGWSKTTTYTVIKKCLDKGAITREDPGFVCTAVITKQEIRRQETEELLDRFFGGRADRLVASLFEDGGLSPEEIARLWQMIGEMK